MYKCEHFILKELVSPLVYNYYVPRFGEEFLWLMFPEQAPRELDFIREKWEEYCDTFSDLKVLSKGIFINTWAFNGNMTQRGLRSNIDSIVKGKKIPYLSAHCSFRAFDLEPANKQYQLFFNFIWDLMIQGRLKFFKRIEIDKVTVPKGYVHIDGIETFTGYPEVFNP